MAAKRSIEHFGTAFSGLFLIMLFIVSGCRRENASERESASGQNVKSAFEKTEIKYAKGFDIEYFDDYKLVTLHHSDGQKAGDLQYVLLPKGNTPPARHKNAEVINIPVESIAATSSMHIGPLAFLEAENTLTGLSDLQYVYSHKVLDMINDGKIIKIGRDNGLNEEKLVEMHPDVVMTVGSPGVRIEKHPVLKEAGIPVMVNSEWIEKTPLGRAEWVKLLAALLNKEKLVNDKFEKIVSEYEKLRKAVAQTAHKPTLISGLNTKDAWFVPSGDGYMAQFFKDAGASYPWSDKKSEGSLPLSFEAVYPVALRAEYWVNVGFDKNDTKAGILGQDKRYADFKAFKSGELYSYNLRVNERGSNDFFESGTVNPHVVLADLVRIFHPDLLPDRELVYYKKLK